MKQKRSSDTCFTGQHFFNNQVQLYLRQQNDFHVYYEPPFYFRREDYAFPPVVTAFWRVVCVVYHWGSTYFVIRIGVESWPPLMMRACDSWQPVFYCWHFCYCAAQTSPATSAAQCRADWPVIAAVGNGMVTVAEHQNVPSGIAP